MITSKNLAKALYLLSTRENISSADITASFFKYIDEYKLESLLPETLKYLEDLNSKDKAFSTLQIDFGCDISGEILNKIKSTIGVDSNSTVVTKEDADLIGGFVATYKGMIYDASIRNQLQLLKQELIKA